MSLGWIIAAGNLNGLQGRDPGGVRCGSSNKVGGVPNGQAVQVWWQAATAPFVDSGLNMWRLRKNMYLFKSIIDKEPLTLWPFFNWQWGMTQTKKTPQQPQDQDDHSPGRQQSGWLEWPLGLAWPLDDQLVGWSNEPLGCIGLTKATHLSSMISDLVSWVPHHRMITVEIWGEEFPELARRKRQRSPDR